MKLVKQVAVGIIVGLMVLVASPAPGSAEQVISLEEAKSMAREKGTDFERLELNFLLAEATYIATRKDLGLGIRESREIREDLDGLRAEVEKMTDRITELRDAIRQWEEELQQLEEETDPEEALEDLEAETEQEAVEELEAKLEEARKEKADLEDERSEYGRAIALVLQHYYDTKSMEDELQPQIRPVEQQLERAEDAKVTGPRLLDHQVENIYFGLLSMDARQEILESNLVLLEKTLEHTRLMKELGLRTEADLNKMEERVREIKQGLNNLQAEEEDLKRTFRTFLGLHSERSFQVQSMDLEYLREDDRLPRKQAPDLTRSISYQRALERLDDKKEDLEDTSPRDVEDYRKAELEVEDAQLALEEDLESLEKQYKAKADQLQVAREAVEDKYFVLENARTDYRHEEIRYDLGLIAAAKLDETKLALLEVEMDYQQGKQDLYLARQAYLLARDGIKMDFPGDNNGWGQ